MRIFIQRCTMETKKSQIALRYLYRSFAKIHRSILGCLEWCRCHHLYSRNRWKCSKRSLFYYQWNQLVWLQDRPWKRNVFGVVEIFPQMIPCVKVLVIPTMKSGIAWRWTFQKSVNCNKERRLRRKPQSSYFPLKKEVVHWKIYSHLFESTHYVRMPLWLPSFVPLSLSLTIPLITMVYSLQEEWMQGGSLSSHLSGDSGGFFVFLEGHQDEPPGKLRCSGHNLASSGRNFLFLLLLMA